MNIWFDYGHTEEKKNWKLRKSSTRRRWRSIRPVSVAAHDCLVGVLSCNRAAKLNKQNPFKRERERRTSLYIEIGFYFVSLILGFWLGDLISFVGFEFPIINLSFLIPVSFSRRLISPVSFQPILFHGRDRWCDAMRCSHCIAKAILSCVSYLVYTTVYMAIPLPVN